jgi:serine/threonine protein kinase
MSSEHLKKVGELFDAALELDPQERPDFLKKACGTDEALLIEVESLIAAHFQAGNFIQTAPFGKISDVIPDEEKSITPGKTIGAYKIVREIGRGGMGTVYLAERADEQFKKYAAIKVLKRGMDTDNLLLHFRRERQILASFDHPNIARLHDGGSTETGLPYFVMEYVEGKPIDEYCDEHELNITQRLELFQQVCGAVSYAHRHLVIHRDIKPSNIVVTAEGVPKLLDFGIAKILQSDEDANVTATGIQLMTPEFASPEQVQGLPVSTASDVYSLGVVLYQLLTGYFPYQFAHRTPLEVARVIITTDPELPSAIIHSTEVVAKTSVSPNKLPKSNTDRLTKRLQGDLDNIVLMSLRKEPHRRYQSIEQFSEDIKRHLNGLPVAARKDTIRYRASKFVNRNKLAVALTVFAFVAILTGGLIAGVIQYRANQQAKFLQEFGQEAARMEGIMRFAYLRPLHDTSAERETVLKQMRAIKSRMVKLGNNAQGPGHYAIGKAWMALHQYGEARNSFELAIKNYGYKTPDLYYAYGLTLAMIYQSELDFAARIAIKEERDVRINEIKKEFKEPALFHIQQGKGSVEYSEYARAMVAFLDEHYEEAIEKSQRAVQQIPWMYEIKRLEGESNRQIGKCLFDQRNYSQAFASFRKAEEAFKNSIQEGTSDPVGYIALCSIQSDVLSLYAETAVKDEVVYLAGKEACLKALKAAPKSASAYLTMGTLNLEWARHLSSDSSTVTILEEAVQVVQHARDLQPEDPKTHKTLGRSYSRLANHHYYFVRKDPRKEVQLGDESLRKAIEMNPNDADAYYLRAQIFETLSQYLIDSGESPQDALNKSRELIEKAISLNPKYFRFYLELGSILCVKAQYESEVGLDLTDSANSAIEAVQKALEKNPGHRPALEYLAWANLVKAEFLATVGKNPIQALDQVEAATREAIRIQHKDAWSYRTLGQALLRKAEFSVNSHKDPTAFVNQAKEALKNGKEDDLVGWPVYTIGAELELVLGRWKMIGGESPESEFKRSQELLVQVAKVGPKPTFFEVWYSRARLFRWWAEWKLQSNQPAEKEIQLGLDEVSKALEMNPRSAEMIGTRGIFWFMQSRSTRVDSQRKELLKKASACFEEAIKMNPNVSHMFSPFVKEIAGLRPSL